MKIKVFVSLVLTFLLIFNLSVSSLALHQVEAIYDNCPFIRMGLDVFPGDDIPAIIPHGYSEPVFIREGSGGRIYCARDAFVIRGASINLLPGQAINMTEEDLDILVDFVIHTLVVRNVGVGFPGYFEDALREAGLYETFFSRIGERINSHINSAPYDSYITPVPHWSTPISESLSNGQVWTGGGMGNFGRVGYNLTFNPFATVDVGFRTQAPNGVFGAFQTMVTHTGTSANGSFAPPLGAANFAIRHSPNSNAFGIFLTGRWESTVWF